MGKLEYSNHAPQYPLQLVTFNPIGGVIHAEPYLFEILEKTIVSKNVHRIKCRPINDKYGSAEITGTIDFSNEFKPKIKLVNEGGHTYISNLSEKGEKRHIRNIYQIFGWEINCRRVKCYKKSEGSPNKKCKAPLTLGFFLRSWLLQRLIYLVGQRYDNNIQK